MTVGAWLEPRLAEVPEPLRARLRHALESSFHETSARTADVCISAAEHILDGVLCDEASRDQALDLLAADALVTFAFEAAAEAPESIVQRAEEAMRRLGRAGAVGDA